MNQAKLLIENNLQALWHQIFRSIRLWSQYDVGFKCAGLTYYAMFAIVPLLSLLITASTIFITKDFIADKVNYYLAQVFKGPILIRLQNFVDSLVGSDYSLVLSIGGILIFLYATTTYFFRLNQMVRTMAGIDGSNNRILENIHYRILGVGYAIVIFLGLIIFSGVQIFVQITDQVLTYVIDSRFLIVVVWLVGFVLMITILSSMLAVYYRMILGPIAGWKRLFSFTIVASLMGFVINKLLAQMLNFSASYQDYGIFSATLSVMIWIFLANVVLLVTAGLIKAEPEEF